MSRDAIMGTSSNKKSLRAARHDVPSPKFGAGGFHRVERVCGDDAGDDADDADDNG